MDATANYENELTLSVNENRPFYPVHAAPEFRVRVLIWRPQNASL